MYGDSDVNPWITAIDIPNLGLKYFEDMVIYYFEVDQFDPSDKG